MAKQAKQTLTCDVCGKEFKNAAGLAAHKSYVHGKIKRKDRIGRGSSKGVALNYCPSCGAKLPTF
jgi:hypothetical protein